MLNFHLCCLVVATVQAVTKVFLPPFHFFLLLLTFIFVKYAELSMAFMKSKSRITLSAMIILGRGSHFVPSLFSPVLIYHLYMCRCFPPLSIVIIAHKAGDITLSMLQIAVSWMAYTINLRIDYLFWTYFSGKVCRCNLIKFIYVLIFLYHCHRTCFEIVHTLYIKAIVHFSVTTFGSLELVSLGL